MPTHFQGSAKETRALNTMIKMARGMDSLNSRVTQEFSEYGLTPGQFGALEVLFHLGTMNQRELGHKMLRSGANTCTVLENLEKDGLVSRERDSEDRRVMKVSLTKKGQEMMARIFPQHAKKLVDLFSVLSDKDQDDLARLCKKLGLGLSEK